jgi:hypothetical protein
MNIDYSAWTPTGMKPEYAITPNMLVHETNRWLWKPNVEREIAKARQEGYEQAQNHMLTPGPVVTIPEFPHDAKDTRTNQLLNELYHDRARLERVVKDAKDLADTFIDLLNGVRDDEDYVAGLAMGFSDAHQE